jgi:hypothetical protein
MDAMVLLGDVSVSPDGTRLALVKNKLANEVAVWSFPDNKEIVDNFNIDGSAIRGEFKPGRILISLLDNDRLFVAHVNGTRSLFNLKERKEIYSVPLTPNPGERLSLTTDKFKRLPVDHALSPDRKLLAFRRGSGFQLISTANGRTVRKVKDSKAGGGLDVVWTVAFRPDGQELVAYYQAFPEKGKLFKTNPPCLKRWEVKTGKEIKTLSLPGKYTFQKRLSWWGHDYFVVWNDQLTEGAVVNFHTGQYLRHLKTHPPGCCSDASPDQRLWVVTTHHPTPFFGPAETPAIYLTGIEAPTEKDFQGFTEQTNAFSHLPEWHLTPDGIEDQRRAKEPLKRTG